MKSNSARQAANDHLSVIHNASLGLPGNFAKAADLSIDEGKHEYRSWNPEIEALQKLMNSLPQGVMMISREGVIEACNKRGAQILGQNENDLIGINLDN